MTQVAYNPLKFLGTINGSPVLDPADIDEAFSAKYTVPAVKATAGMYGKGGHELSFNTNAEFMITLKAKSPTNSILSALHSTRSRFSCGFVNRNTNREAAFSRACRVEEAPSVGGGVSAGDRAWKISALEAEIVHDGYREEIL